MEKNLIVFFNVSQHVDHFKALKVFSRRKKTENKLGLSCAKLRIVELKIGVRNINVGWKIEVGQLAL